MFENLFRMPDESRPQQPTMAERIAKLEQFAGLVSRDMTAINNWMQFIWRWGEDVDVAISKLYMASTAANTAGPPGGPADGSPAGPCEAKPDYERLLKEECAIADRLRRVNGDLAIALERERNRVAELQKPPAPPKAPPKPKRVRNRTKKGKAAK